MLKPRPSKRLSDLLPNALGPAAARQGFAGAEIVSRWEAIVGPELAAVSAPKKLAAPPRAPAADPDAPPPRATLTVSVEGAFALEIQHRSAEIIERVNAHLGWACVGLLKVRQGAVAELKRKTPAPPALPEPTGEERARVEAAASVIEDDGLAAAVRRLGAAALASGRR